MKPIRFILKMIISLILLTNYHLFAQTKYNVDKEKSVLTWVGKKVLGEHTGYVKIASGNFIIDKTKIISGKFEINMNSITDNDLTDTAYNAKLVGHLKSSDFFDVKKHPVAVFEITQPSVITKGNTLIKGKLTIKGITNPIEFKAVIIGTDEIKAYANIVVDRSKYNIQFGSSSFIEGLGDKTIYDEFYITVNLVAKKQ